LLFAGWTIAGSASPTWVAMAKSVARIACSMSRADFLVCVCGASLPITLTVFARVPLKNYLGAKLCNATTKLGGNDISPCQITEILSRLFNTDLVAALTLPALADTLTTANFVFIFLATAAQVLIISVTRRFGIAATILTPKVIVANASATF
jgi:hypothetical protein